MKRQVRTYSFKDILANLSKADESTVRDYIGVIKDNNSNRDLLSPQEAEALKAFEDLYRDSGSVPTIDLFNSYYPQYKLTSDLQTNNLYGLIRVFIKQRKNGIAADKLYS